MLILSRKQNQRIFIGDDIIITVLGMQGKQIRIGIDAPDDVEIHREEIYERIKSEQENG